MNITINSDLENLWSLTEDWIDDDYKKTNRSMCRIGTNIEKKNDQKRVDDSNKLVVELRKLSNLFFLESGLAEKNGLDPIKDYEDLQ